MQQSQAYAIEPEPEHAPWQSLGADTTAVARRATVKDIVEARDRALSLYSEAYAAIERAHACHVEATHLTAQGISRWNHHLHSSKCHFEGLLSMRLPTREEYMNLARLIVDTDVWTKIIDLTDLQRVMDKTAKDALRQQMIQNPLEVTVDNVTATVESMIGEAMNMFLRGIATCFSKLDRRFRSHDGWKIGGKQNRVILNHAFNEWGNWAYSNGHEDTLMDIERVFTTLDKKGLEYFPSPLLDAIKARKGHGWYPTSFEVETEHFKARVFKNGNLHLWFLRKDLLEEVNKLLARWYGEVLADGDKDQAPDPLQDTKLTLARNFGFFPTPPALVKTVIDQAHLYRHRGGTADLLRVLEPSAGTGNLARAAAAQGCIVDCIEVQADLALDLQREGIYNKVLCADFLLIKPEPLYDRVIMNPPFDRERDIDHIMHAWKFLKPGGTLISIMSAGTEWRSMKKSTAFRAFVCDLLGKDEGADLHRIFNEFPPGSFSSVGTNVNTVWIRLHKPEVK